MAIEPKDDIKKRLGHSPDVGEALMLANLKSDGGDWGDFDDIELNVKSRWVE